MRVVLLMCRNPSTYSLYTETEKNASDTSQYTSGKTVGRAEAIAEIQEDLASEGLAIITYLEEGKSDSYTTEWFYQPGMGWIWTNKEIFLISSLPPKQWVVGLL